MMAGAASPSFRSELKKSRCRGTLTETTKQPILDFYGLSDLFPDVGEDHLTANHITAYFALKYLECLGEKPFVINPRKE